MTSFLFSLSGLVLGLILAPLLPGIIHRVKAKVGGRRGRPLLQLYYDLRKLARKRPVYSITTSWLFRAGPVVTAAVAVSALCVTPFGGFSAPLGFDGDFLFLAGVFACGRLFMILAALDTGSAFEGMGSAREALFGALAEPVLLFCLAVLAYNSSNFQLARILGGISPGVWTANWPFFVLLSFALFLLLLVENCRIPVDDPNTHLELTMIHEVMALDHSGPDLALIEYGAALKLWCFCLLLSGLLIPVFYGPLFSAEGALRPGVGAAVLALNGCAALLLIFILTVLVGLVESLMARLRMERVPQILTLAGSFAGLAALLAWSHA